MNGLHDNQCQLILCTFFFNILIALQLYDIPLHIIKKSNFVSYLF